MKILSKFTIASLALAGLMGPAALTPALAQGYVQVDVPVYTTWQPTWDQYQFDQKHVMLGVVEDFAPYRLTVTRRDGVTQTVDLKNGTRIYPIGSTPSQGERVAMVGYWSNGTFIVNRLVLRS